MAPAPPAAATNPRMQIAQGVLLGAGMAGFADAMDAIVAAPMHVATPLKVALGLASAGLLGATVLLVLVPIIVVSGHRIATLAGDPPRWPGFWMGLGSARPIQLGLGILTGLEPDWRAALAAVVAPLAAGAIALAIPTGRTRVFAVMLGIAPLVVQVELGRRVVPTPGFPAADAPHILLVTIEGLRGGDWPAPAPRLPSIDAAAAKGVRFERAFTPVPAVDPALDAVLHGHPPWEAPTATASVAFN